MLGRCVVEDLEAAGCGLRAVCLREVWSRALARAGSLERGCVRCCAGRVGRGPWAARQAWGWGCFEMGERCAAVQWCSTHWECGTEYGEAE